MGRRKKIDIEESRWLAMPEIDLADETKSSIYTVLIFVFGIIFFLSLFGLAGSMGVFIDSMLDWAFGWGKWAYPIVFSVWGWMLYKKEENNIRTSNYIGLALFVLSMQAFLLLLVDPTTWTTALDTGSGGGYVGYIFGSLAVNFAGRIAAFIIMTCLIIISLLLILDTTLAMLIGRDSHIARALFSFHAFFKGLFNKEELDENGEAIEAEENPEEEDADEAEEESEGEEEIEEEIEEESEEEGEEEEEKKERAKKKKAPAKKAVAKVPKVEELDTWWQHKNGIDIDLPLSLLSAKKSKPQSGDIKESKEIIQNTLQKFGIDVEMGDVAVGPTVTQYTFKPADGVKLSRIVTLGNDLALALAAHPIRIEAPIPGKSLVGIEVPNKTKAAVGFREMLSSKNYEQRKNDLVMALGKDVSGTEWMADITRMPHILVAGATNSGKSVCLNTIIVGLLYQNNPDDLRFIMVDPKRVEMPGYNGIPHLLTPVITDVPKTVNALKWCLGEMDRRFEHLAKFGKRNIQSYNETAKVKMPYIVFIIDELADLMVVAAKDIESSIIRLAQMSRAVGIHLILATQRPSVNVITGLIKANMPARIAFSVASSMDSRTILDCLGAEKLIGRGDMLFMTAEISKPVRVQGAFLSDEEIEKVVKHIKSRSDGETFYLDEIVAKQKGAGGPGGVGEAGSGDNDELFEEAKATVIEMKKASASLLQRKFRIGYSRAASLIDSLEQAGIIGGSNGSKPRELLITPEQFDSMNEMAVSGASLHNRDESVAPDSYLGDDEDLPPIFTEEESEEGDASTSSARGDEEMGDESDGEDSEEEPEETGDDEEELSSEENEEETDDGSGNDESSDTDTEAVEDEDEEFNDDADDESDKEPGESEKDDKQEKPKKTRKKSTPSFDKFFSK